MRDFKVGDRIKYRVRRDDTWQEDIVTELITDALFRENFRVKSFDGKLLQPSECERYNLRPEDFFQLLLEEKGGNKETICTCTSRAIFNFGCPSARGLPCRNGKE